MDTPVSLSFCSVAENNRLQEKFGDKYTLFKPCNGLFRDFHKIACYYSWSPVVFSNNYRRSANFKFADLAVLDFDGGVSLAQGIEWIKDNDFCAFIGTTRNHQIFKQGVVTDRFRVALRTSETCRDYETYEYTIGRLAAETKGDKACKDAGRFFYQCKEHILSHPGKNRINWIAPPFDKTKEYRDIIARQVARTEYRDESKIPPTIWGHILWGCRPPGRHKLCYIIGAHLGLRGFSVEEILSLLIKNKSPLMQIGVEDVRRAVANGSNKANGLC